MSQKLEDNFNECLEQMLKGEGIEDCLNAHPEQTSELEPLLKTVLVFTQKSSAIQPSPEFKAKIHSRLQAMFYARQEKVERRARIPVWYRKWALAMTAILGFLLIGVGTVFASAYALPDELLYPVKLGGEQVRLTLAFSDVSKAKLHIQFAERRVGEMVGMAGQGKSDKISMLTEQIANHLDKLYVMEETQIVREEGPKAMAPAPSSGAEAYSKGKDSERLEMVLRQSRAKSLETLRDALDKAPEELKPVLQQAIESMEEDYSKTIAIVESSSSQ